MKIRNPFLFLPFICIPVIAAAQTDIKSYVSSNAVEIRNIAPDSTDYSDLAAIGKAIGNARIVMLGEQDHGDAPTFLAKTRLVKYLHDQLGFNVLAFESDFFGMNSGWDKLDKKNADTVYSFLRKNITPVWPYCDACEQLFKKIIPTSQSTNNPIIMTGFDNQVFYNYSYKNLVREMDSVFKALDLPLTHSPGYPVLLKQVIDSLSQPAFVDRSIGFYNNCVQELEKVKAEIQLKTNADNFWFMMVENLIALSNELRDLQVEISKGLNARDLQMAKNLQWLSTVKYPKEKIIVWAQNWHISKYSGRYSQKYMNKGISMGTAFTLDSMQLVPTYSIGFTSHSGTAGRIGSNSYALQEPTDKSFESWIDPSYEYAFIDFTLFNQQHPSEKTEFLMKGSTEGFHKNQKAQWTKNFDAVFYIKNMFPCKYLK